MWKKLGLIFFILFLGALFLYRNLLGYGFSQAKGQLSLLMNTEEVADVLANPSFPDSLKQRIRLIQEIKQFGVDSIGLKPSDNYTTFYNQHGHKIMWMLSASGEFDLDPKMWEFPLIGEFPYKGYFDSTMAHTEQKSLIDEGYDTYMGSAAAWSLLGFAREPILSSMLERGPGSLANLILHEQTHGTLFVKGNMELNENLASFIGDWGAERFLIYKYGIDSKEVKNYKTRKVYNDAWAQHMLRGATQLDSLYQAIEKFEYSKKKELKEQYLKQIVQSADTLLSGRFPLDSQIRSYAAQNNAYFINYKTYKAQQNVFEDEFKDQFDRDFKRYMTFLQEKYPNKWYMMFL